MHPSNVRLKPPDASEPSLSSADCIINTSIYDKESPNARGLRLKNRNPAVAAPHLFNT